MRQHRYFLSFFLVVLHTNLCVGEDADSGESWASSVTTIPTFQVAATTPDLVARRLSDANLTTTATSTRSSVTTTSSTITTTETGPTTTRTTTTFTDTTITSTSTTTTVSTNTSTTTTTSTNTTITQSRTTTTTSTTTTSPTRTTTTSNTSTTVTSSTLTSTTTSTTTITTTWNNSWVVPFCPLQLMEQVLKGNVNEVQRQVILDQSLNCRTDFEYLLTLTLRLGQRDMSYFVATTLVPGCPHLTVRNATGATPLIQAAEQGFTETVELLILKGVNTTDKDYAGRTALHTGAQWPETSKKLVEDSTIYKWHNGTEAIELLFGMDDYGDYTIHHALKDAPDQDAATRAAFALIDQVEIREGDVFTYVNLPDAKRNVPAHLTGDFSLLKEMQRRGARMGPEILNYKGASPFHTVAATPGSMRNGALVFVAGFMNITVDLPNTTDASVVGSSRRLVGDLARVVFTASDAIEMTDNFLQTPLHYAAGGGDSDNIRWLIDRGADPSRKDARGDTPLAYAIRQDKTHLVHTFASYGGTPLSEVVKVGNMDVLRGLVASLDVHQLDPLTGRTAIFDAVEEGEVEMVAFFADEGVDLMHKDFFGWSVLSAAAHAGQNASMRILIEKGAEVNQRLGNGSTALMVAAAAGHQSCVQVLLDAYALVDAQDLRGRTALHQVTTGAAAEALIKKGATSIETFDLSLLPLHVAAYAGRTDVLQALLFWRFGGVTSINAPSSSGDTPLHLAVISNNLAAAQMLLEWCVDAIAMNKANKTPSEYATSRAIVAMVRDASSMKGRCQCDCGQYKPDPLYTSAGWSAGCTARISCRLRALQGSSEQVTCKPSSEGTLANTTALGLPPGAWYPSSAEGVWTPKEPRLVCNPAVTSDASWIRPASLLLPVLWLCRLLAM